MDEPALPHQLIFRHRDSPLHQGRSAVSTNNEANAPQELPDTIILSQHSRHGHSATVTDRAMARWICLVATIPEIRHRTSPKSRGNTSTGNIFNETNRPLNAARIRDRNKKLSALLSMHLLAISDCLGGQKITLAMRETNMRHHWTWMKIGYCEDHPLRGMILSLHEFETKQRSRHQRECTFTLSIPETRPGQAT